MPVIVIYVASWRTIPQAASRPVKHSRRLGDDGHAAKISSGAGLRRTSAPDPKRTSTGWTCVSLMSVMGHARSFDSGGPSAKISQ